MLLCAWEEHSFCWCCMQESVHVFYVCLFQTTLKVQSFFIDLLSEISIHCQSIKVHYRLCIAKFSLYLLWIFKWSDVRVFIISSIIFYDKSLIYNIFYDKLFMFSGGQLEDILQVNVKATHLGSGPLEAVLPMLWIQMQWPFCLPDIPILQFV